MEGIAIYMLDGWSEQCTWGYHRCGSPSPWCSTLASGIRSSWSGFEASEYGASDCFTISARKLPPTRAPRVVFALVSALCIWRRRSVVLSIFRCLEIYRRLYSCFRSSADNVSTTKPRRPVNPNRTNRNRLCNRSGWVQRPQVWRKSDLKSTICNRSTAGTNSNLVMAAAAEDVRRLSEAEVSSLSTAVPVPLTSDIPTTSPPPHLRTFHGI